MQKRLDREQPGEQRYKDHADYGYTSAGHELFYPQLGVKTLLDGGSKRETHSVSGRKVTGASEASGSASLNMPFKESAAP